MRKKQKHNKENKQDNNKQQKKTSKQTNKPNVPLNNAMRAVIEVAPYRERMAGCSASRNFCKSLSHSSITMCRMS
jgi:hypothetical protein